MTTIREVEIQCAVCGRSSEQVVLTSTNAFGSADLDLRPPEMQRSTIHTWVQRCPHCGYCNVDLSHLQRAASQVMHSEAYRDQLADRTLSALANTFLCVSLILAAQDELSAAGWKCLHAAWICDDERNTQGAVVCRRRAGSLFQQALVQGELVVASAAMSNAVLVDVLRRSQQFALAQSLCEDGLRQFTDDVMQSVLRFQSLLIQRSDTGCYTVVQALGNA